MENIILNLATLSGLVLGLTQVVNRAFNLPERFTQLVEVILGIGISLIYIGLTRDAALLGLFAGLSAAGLWNGATTFGNILIDRAKNKETPGRLSQV
jgi:hypothetical protein